MEDNVKFMLQNNLRSIHKASHLEHKVSDCVIDWRFEKSVFTTIFFFYNKIYHSKQNIFLSNKSDAINKSDVKDLTKEKRGKKN